LLFFCHIRLKLKWEDAATALASIIRIVKLLKKISGRSFGDLTDQDFLKLEVVAGPFGNRSCRHAEVTQSERANGRNLA
jgi:hypothetical protein